jgi:hypothetical protein
MLGFLVATSYFNLFNNLPEPVYVCVCVCGCKQAGAGYVSTGQLSLEAEKTWLQYECDRSGLTFNLEGNPGISPSIDIGLFHTF